MLPLDYAVRNLGRSPLRLAMSVVGAMLVALLVLTASAFVRGMERSLIGSGSLDNVVLLGAGSEESIERSEIKASVASQAAASIHGIRSQLGQAYVSPEVHMALPVTGAPDTTTSNQVLIRGISAAAYLVHPQVRIVDGRAPRQGADEIMLGRLAHTRMGLTEDAASVGRSLYFEDRAWKIVGRFDAPGTVMNAEIWTPLNDLMVAARRDTISCVVLTLGDAEFADVDAFAKTRLDLELTALPEADYYGQLVAFYTPVRMMIWLTAGLIALCGLFGGLNTMYAAFVSRVREIGMLQSLGYSRRAIAISFAQESLIAAACGTLIAAVAGMMLLDGLAVRISMGAFGLRMDTTTLMLGLGAGLLLGLIGALPPTVRCLRMPIPAALKAA
ncbi:ABC transporter permease [Planctomycetales bacterium ZRK34]|nr:ABC transporter permease [Planctomycetales bacterium ZRK34]